MKQFIGCDAHKKYSVFVAMDEKGKTTKPVQIPHDLESYRKFLAQLPAGSHIAVEATGHWYWIVDEMERANHIPHLTDPLEAKKRMGKTHKSDPIDARGLSLLLRCGTLPEVWIPPAALRDQRELLRTRMALRDLRTALKHRIHAAIDRYGLHTETFSDIFGTKGRDYIAQCIAKLPPVTGTMVQVQLDALDQLKTQIDAIEKRIHSEISSTPAVLRLMTLPGVGATLGPVIAFEIGDISRFARPANLASYAGLVPRLISSGGHTRHGRTSRNINPYLKWAFVEAAVCACRLNGPRYSHVRNLFARLFPCKGFGRAVVAVARHLAEASFWVLSKNQNYRPPQPSRLIPQQLSGNAATHGGFVTLDSSTNG
jgi:transposase